MGKPNFQTGDLVECIDATNRREIKEGYIYEVDYLYGKFGNIRLKDIAGSFAQCRFKLAQSRGANCDHDWKRLDLFRTTEFCCTKCPATREFDRERDSA
jgi:hypothetical protein